VISDVTQTTGHKGLQGSTTCGQAVPGFDVFNPESRRTRMVKQFGRLRGRRMCAKIALSQNGTAVIRG
jgi:hypothetical protein